MAKGGWIEERDGSFFMGTQSPRQKPPPATPWGKLTEEWRYVVHSKHHWQGSLKEVLEAAASGMRQANKAPRKAGKGSRWGSVEAFLHGYAKHRRWIISLDPSQDLVTIRPDPGKQPPSQKPPRTDVIQPSLFDLD